MFIPTSKRYPQLQDSLALSIVPIVTVHKNTLKTKFSYCACSVMAVGRVQVKTYPSVHVPTIAWWVSKLPVTDAQGCPPATPGAETLVWIEADGRWSEWCCWLLLGLPLLGRKDKGSQLWQLHGCNNSLLRSCVGEQDTHSCTELENVHGSPSNNCLPWHFYKRRNFANSGWKKKRRF